MPVPQNSKARELNQERYYFYPNQFLKSVYFADVIEDQQVSQWHNTVLDINMEEWLHLIPEETFRTEFYEISVEDAKTFVAAYECRHVQSPPMTELPASLQNKLNAIELGLQKVIDSVRSSTLPIFRKLS